MKILLTPRDKTTHVKAISRALDIANKLDCSVFLILEGVEIEVHVDHTAQIQAAWLAGMMKRVPPIGQPVPFSIPQLPPHPDDAGYAAMSFQHKYVLRRFTTTDAPSLYLGSELDVWVSSADHAARFDTLQDVEIVIDSLKKNPWTVRVPPVPVAQ